VALLSNIFKSSRHSVPRCFSHCTERANRPSSKGSEHNSSSLESLSPFIDQFGLQRVDGRQRNSSLDFNVSPTIILPQSKSVSTQFHERHLHICLKTLPLIFNGLLPIGIHLLVFYPSVVNALKWSLGSGREDC